MSERAACMSTILIKGSASESTSSTSGQCSMGSTTSPSRATERLRHRLHPGRDLPARTRCRQARALAAGRQNDRPQRPCAFA
jgi:hypothetical protein